MDECNVFGGAVSLGYSLGCSGARIICTLVNALLQHQLHSGLLQFAMEAEEQQLFLSKCILVLWNKRFLSSLLFYLGNFSL